MRFSTFIIFYFIIISIVNSQDSKKISEKYFSDFDIEVPTPAFNKKKGFTKYLEMMYFLDELCKKYPNKVSYEYIGKSQKEKQIPMVYLGEKKADNFKVCFMGGLHGNEPASTEGMLYFLDKILNDLEVSYLLDRIELAVVPMANIDGYLKQSRYAANGLDLNRDQTKLMAPESIVIKQAFSDFNPEVALDFHEYRPYRKDFAQLSNFGITALYDAMFLNSGNLNVPKNLRLLTQSLFIENAEQVLDENNFNHHPYISTKKYSGDIHFNQGSTNARSSATNFALTNTISTLFEIFSLPTKFINLSAIYGFNPFL